MQRKNEGKATSNDTDDIVGISLASVEIPLSQWDYKIPTLSQDV
jgi:hypothetical protein